MSDFLTRLAQRQLGQISSVEPRLPELYAPVTAAMPLPMIAETASTAADGPRITTLPTRANPPQGSEPLVPTRRQEGPEAAANFAQPLVAKPSAVSTAPRAGERLSVETVPLAEPNLNAQESRVEFAVTAPFEFKQTDSLSAQPQARAAEAVLMRPAPPRLMSAPAALAVAAPPRLETKAPNGLEAAGREREPADSEPPIRVTIGRIEVTALTQAAPPRRAPAPRKPAMSLDDYLARRQKGER